MNAIALSGACCDADDLWFINTCHAWRGDGPLHSLLKRGDVEGLKSMSARSQGR